MSATDSPSAFAVLAATARLFWDPVTGKATAEACLQVRAVGTFAIPGPVPCTGWGVEFDSDTTNVQNLVGVAQLFTVSSGCNLALLAHVDANPNGGSGAPHVYVWLSDNGVPITLSDAYAALIPGATLGVQLLVGVAGNQTVVEP